MTEHIELRLADYRRQVEALEAVALAVERLDQLQRDNSLYSRGQIADAWIAVRGALDAAALVRPEPEPKPEERVSIWDKWDLRFVVWDVSAVFQRKLAEDWIAARPASAGRYEIQPVARRKVIVTVKLDGPCDGLKVGDRVMRWGVVTRVEERDAD